LYYGATADLVYSFNKNAKASVGIRYAGNNDGGFMGSSGIGFDPNDGLLNRENNFYWGTKLSAGF